MWNSAKVGGVGGGEKTELKSLLCKWECKQNASQSTRNFLAVVRTKSTKEAIEHYIKCDLIVVVKSTKRESEEMRIISEFDWKKEVQKCRQKRENQINSIRYMKMQTICVVPQKNVKTETKSKPLRLRCYFQSNFPTTHTHNPAMRAKWKQKHIP